MKPEYLAPSLILLMALYTDVKSRKIPNKLVLVSIVIALVSSFYLFQFEGLRQGAIGGGLAIAMTLPLVLIGALGAGDMKLMFAFGLATTYSAVFSVLVFSFIWAAVIGIGLALASGRARQMLNNIILIILARGGPDTTKLQRIPYSIPLVLGWITFIVLALRQGSIL